MTDEQKKLIEVSQPFSQYLVELAGGDSYNKLQAMTKLQEAVWWSEKHLTEISNDKPTKNS